MEAGLGKDMFKRGGLKKAFCYFFTGIVVLFLLSSCDFAPKLKVPKVELPSNSTFLPASKKGFKISWGWWKQFKNPTLNKLIKEALKNNADLLIATAKVEELMALAGFRKAQLYPNLGYKAQVSRTKVPEELEDQINGFDAAFSTLSSRLGLPSSGTSLEFKNPSTSYNFVGSVSYELDFWGKLRNAKKAAVSKLLAAKAMQDTVKISLVSGVVTTYYGLLTVSNELKLAKKLESTLKRIYLYRKKQYEIGTISKVLVCQAKAEYQQAKELVESLKQKKSKLESTLAYLVGESPKKMFENSIKVEGKLPEQLKIPSMLPSEVLLHRPDIIAAEEELKAANFNVGVAKALYFPDITLTGYGGTMSSEFKNLIKSSSIFWSIGTSLTGPLFDFGRIKSQIKLREAQKKEALYNYIKTVRNAFKEVFVALRNVNYCKKSLEIERQRLDALKETLEIQRGLFKNGLTSELEVLGVYANYLREKMQLLQLENQLVSSYVYLYKALGGGVI